MNYLDNTGLTHFWSNIKTVLMGKQNRLTGLPGQVVGFGKDGSAAAVPGWSSPNLLINGDFRSPVNRNGKTEYRANGKNVCAVDCWKLYVNTKLTVSEGKVTISAIEDGALQIFQYLSYRYDSLLNQRLCVSLLDGAGNLYTASGTVSGPEPTAVTNIAFVRIPGVGRLNFTYSPNSKKYYVHVYNSAVAAGTSLDIVAIKLELGAQQTLAAKDADGNWRLSKAPCYSNEYLLSGLYSQNSGNWAGIQYGNPNLLDNWYLADPVNQRGKNWYEESGYTVDRWKLNAPSCKLALTDGKTVVELHRYGGIGQMIEDGAKLRGRRVTVSLLGKTTQGKTYLTMNDGVRCRSIDVLPNEYGLLSGSFVVPKDAVSFAVFVAGGGAEVNRAEITAMKVELGSQQTLACRDESGNWVLNDQPDYARELSRCQRYYQVFTDKALRPTKAEDFRPSMRINPTLGTVNINGTTYYTANAEL